MAATDAMVAVPDNADPDKRRKLERRKRASGKTAGKIDCRLVNYPLML